VTEQREGAEKVLRETQEELKDTQRRLAEAEAERDDARQQVSNPSLTAERQQPSSCWS